MTGLRRTLRDRRGFTLVELVVVLVILGITASFAVPALTGYIDTSKEKKAVSEAQACVMAATDLAAARYAEDQQAVINAQYGGPSTLANLKGWAQVPNPSAPELTTGDVALIEGRGEYRLHVSESLPSGTFPATGDTTDFTEQADVSGTISTLTLTPNGQLLYLVYTSADGIQVVYTNDGSTTTVKDNDNVVVVPTPKATDTPTPTVTPSNTATPEPSTTATPQPTATATPTVTPLPGVSQGDLIFYIKDQDATGEDDGIPGVEFELFIRDTDEVVGTATSDKDGMISFKVNLDNSGKSPHPYTKGNYTLRPKSWPDNYQEMRWIDFTIYPSNKEGTDGDWSEHPASFRISVTNNANEKYGYDYNEGSLSNNNRTYTFYVPHILYGTINKIDDYGKQVKGALLKIHQNIDGTANDFTINTDECPKKIALKMHTGDAVPAGENYLQAKKDFTITESITPLGYLPIMESKITFDTRFASSNEQNTNIEIADNGYTVNVIDHNKQTCTVTVNKVDDRGEPLPGAQLLIYQPGGNATSTSISFTSGTAAYATELKPGSYTLKESASPSDDYKIAPNIDFTIESGVFTYTLTMIDHNADIDKGDVTLDNVIFPDAENWAHKLTHDPTPKFNGEVLYWKGNYYYSYTLAKTTENPYKKQWDDKNLDLNAPSIPDPVEFYNKYKKATDAADLVLKLGKLWNEANIKTVSAANPIQRGDLYLSSNNLCVYIGSEPLTKTPPENPASKISYPSAEQGNNPHKNWSEIDSSKYTVK